jgi:hypothetical protein
MKIEMIGDRARLIPENEAELNAIHEIRLVGIVDSTLTGKLPKEAVLELKLACAPSMFGRYGETPSPAFDKKMAQLERYVRLFGSVSCFKRRQAGGAD